MPQDVRLGRALSIPTAFRAVMRSLWIQRPIGWTGLGKAALTRVAPGSSVGGSNLRRVAAIVTLAFLAMVGTPRVSVAAATLDGEQFAWRGSRFNGNFTCDGPTIFYQVFGGSASGPFDGVFREDGVVSVAGGTVGEWRGHFTVTDAATGAIVIDGNTTLVSGGTGVCNSVNFGQSVNGEASATLLYRTTIRDTSGGVLAIASGTATARMTFARGGDNVTGSRFDENLGGVDGFTLSGRVFDTSIAGPLVPGAVVQLCQLPAGPCSLPQTTLGDGAFRFTGLADLTRYEVRTDPPAGFRLLPHIRVVKLDGSTVKDLFLHAPVASPPGTTITSRGTNPDGLPVVYWLDPLILTTTGCPGATRAAYGIDVPPAGAFGDFMTEGPAGTYSASIAPLDPIKGYGSVEISLTCPGDPFPTDVIFDIYVDPSGTVRTTTGEPVPGATVTLLRSDTAGGPFTPVPDGSATMSLENRDNPDTADTRGLFGWDVIGGTYQIRAEKTGCVSPTDPTQTFVLSPVLVVPPAIADLDLRLACRNRDTTPPTTTAIAVPAPNANGWNNGDVTVTLSASDEPGGSGVKEIRFSLTGAQGGSGVVAGSTASVKFSSEGNSTLTYFATDNAGNNEAAKTLVVRIDKTAPTVTFGSRTPPANAAGWNNGDVSIAFAAADSLSGVGITTPSSPLILTTEGRGVTRTVTVADLAGNTATFTSPAVNIDKSPPTVACVQLPRQKRDDEDGGNLLLEVTASDNLSQVTITLGAFQLAQGEIIQIWPTRRPGVQLVGDSDDEDRANRRFRRFRVGPGANVIKATDEAGNVGTAVCPVPSRQADDDDGEKGRARTLHSVDGLKKERDG